MKEWNLLKLNYFIMKQKGKNSFWEFIFPKPFNYDIKYLMPPVRSKKFQTLYEIIYKAEELYKAEEKEACKDVLTAAINHINRNF